MWNHDKLSLVSDGNRHHYKLFWTGHKTNRTLTRRQKYIALRFRTQRGSPACVHCATQEHAYAQGSTYMFPLPLLITRRITWRRLLLKRTYIRVNLLHPQGTHHFPQHFLHTLLQFHYWLERWSANVHADTLRSTVKTHRHRVGSSYRHNGTFSAIVATQTFSPDRSFGATRRGLFPNRHGPTILPRNRFQLRASLS